MMQTRFFWSAVQLPAIRKGCKFNSCFGLFIHNHTKTMIRILKIPSYFSSARYFEQPKAQQHQLNPQQASVEQVNDESLHGSNHVFVNH
uniref:Uncharacterized protein n=1 Tax=Solanum lycopersicum TaxID=4081 RepID=A0A3Q7GKH2_SOLLC